MAHRVPGDRDRPEGDTGSTKPLSAEKAAEARDGQHGVADDELRVQRSEEELGAEVRLREAGAVRVRKTVHTDYEEFQIPKRREEVEVERVAADRIEASEVPEGTELGEDEMVMRVYEEEISVSKRLVLKEEIRLRKEVVEEEEFFEADLRREEVEIDDETERGIRQDG